MWNIVPLSENDFVVRSSSTVGLRSVLQHTPRSSMFEPVVVALTRACVAPVATYLFVAVTAGAVPVPGVAFAILNAKTAFSSSLISSSICAVVAVSLAYSFLALSISAFSTSAPFMPASYIASASSAALASAWYCAMDVLALPMASFMAFTASATSASVEVAVIALVFVMAAASSSAAVLHIMCCVNASASAVSLAVSANTTSADITPMRLSLKLSVASQLPVAPFASKPIVAPLVRLVNVTL